MNAAAHHPRNCVCVRCLATIPPPVVEAISVERVRADHSVTLTGQQAHALKIFTSIWNADRARRGEAPISRHEALTKLLGTALDLVGAKGMIGT